MSGIGRPSPGNRCFKWRGWQAGSGQAITSMTTLEVTQHPELASLAAELRKGQVVTFTDHGAPLGEALPARRGRDLWKSRLEGLHQSFTSPAYAGNSVADMRRESR
jgi:hypothetical protein